MGKRVEAICVAAVLLVNLILPLYDVNAESKPVYSINPSSKTYRNNMMNFTTYNSHTKHYYLLRSYLERLEQKGGGTLVLKKGTYTISNTLYVPSNVTIKMEDGVKVMKGNKTGTSMFASAKSIFQLIRPTKSSKRSVYGQYNGEKNISLIGEGSVIIDMKYEKDGIAIIMGHNKNIKVENIHFKNMHSGHFIEMDASEDVAIRKNSFTDSKASENVNKEAINLDTPDKNTNGWSQAWSTYDKTPNKNVIIENNHFKNLDRAVGTHKYSEGKYHDNIVIRNNIIEKTRSDAIRVMNWSNAEIKNNIIKDVENGKAGTRGILASGATNPTFKKNTFQKVGRTIQFMAWKNSGPGSTYKTTYNRLNKKNKKDLTNNIAIDTDETFIRINNSYNEYILNTEKIDLVGQENALKRGMNKFIPLFYADRA